MFAVKLATLALDHRLSSSTDGSRDHTRVVQKIFDILSIPFYYPNMAVIG